MPRAYAPLRTSAGFPQPESGLPNPRALVLFASTHGHTARIATRLADRLVAGELDVDLASLHEESPSPHGYDLVVLGGSVHGGHHQQALRDWLIVNRAGLDPTRTALFSVSITAAEEHEEAYATTETYLDGTAHRRVPTAGLTWAAGRVIRIVVADNHAAFRHGLVTPLGAEDDLCVVAEATDVDGDADSTLVAVLRVGTSPEE